MPGSRTIEIEVPIDDEWHELLIAELADLDFDAFETEHDVVRAYVRASRWSDVSRHAIEKWLLERGFPTGFTESVHEPNNWNRVWEETVRPVPVGVFLIKSTWAAVPDAYRDLLLLEIDPKMSFGTGYHESTRLALRALPQAMTSGAAVLDAGTGTGILAVAAARLGASMVIAFDNDDWSFVNAIENSLINRVADVVSIRKGSLEVVAEDSFDLIVANVNLHVLLAMIPSFSRKLKANGRIVLAGLLQKDRESILDAATKEGLSPDSEQSENEWWSVTLARNNR